MEPEVIETVETRMGPNLVEAIKAFRAECISLGFQKFTKLIPVGVIFGVRVSISLEFTEESSHWSGITPNIQHRRRDLTLNDDPN